MPDILYSIKTSLATIPAGHSTDKQPIVFIKDGGVFANSRDVAAYFGKDIKHVHEAIKNLISKEPELVSPNFRPFKINDLTGESISHYDMTRDGFTLLAMGFTGRKALQFKLRYIEQFNAMEAQIKQQATPVVDFSDPKILLGVVNHLQIESAKKDEVIAEQGARLKKLDRIEGADGSLCITNTAKTLKMRPKDLFSFLSARKWIYRRAGNGHWTGYQGKIQTGLLEHKVTEITRSDGTAKVTEQVLVTPKGLVKLAELLEQPLH